MGNGVFGKWFKEFATLVFTQAVQAFLLAIVMTIIISCLAEAKDDNGVNASGLLCIIALASFNKIELLIKQIFGIHSQFGPDMKSGASSLMKTGLAIKGVRKISDNVPKITEGLRDMKIGKDGMAAANMAGNDEAFKNALSGNKNGNTTNPDGEDNKEEVENQIQEQVIKLHTLENVGELTEAIKNLSKDMQTSNKSNLQSKAKDYEDKWNQGRKQVNSGIRESIGASVGLVGGAMMGLAQGDDIVSTALSGAGFGDELGTRSAAKSERKREYNRNLEKVLDLKNSNGKAISEKMNKMIEDAAKAQGKELEDFINENAKQIEEAKASYIRSVEDSMKNAVSKSTTKPASSRTSNRKLKDLHKIIDSNTNAGDIE